MKPYYNINIKAAIVVGLKDFDFNDLALYEYCRDAILWEDGKPLWHDNRQWKWVSYDLIKTNIPCFEYSDKTLYRMLVKLCNLGLIERCPANKKQGMVYLAVGKVGIKMERVIREMKAENSLESTSDRIVLPLGQSSPTPRTELSEYSNTEYSKQKIVHERETHAQEVEQKPILEQTNHKAEEVAKPQISTLDIPFCEGHKMKIAVHEYPKQPKGAPFIHPDLVGRIPHDKRIELWWALYGIKQAEMKVEFEMIHAGIADDATYAEIYRHTFLYVAVTDTRFRSKPLSYWKNKEWKDDIIDRREKKEVADSTGVAITNAPAPKSRMEREAEEREIQRKIEAKLEAEHEAYISGIEKALEERDRRAANK